MKREEEIRKATLEFVSAMCQYCSIKEKCKETEGYCTEYDSQECGFVAGVQWADEHLNLESIWHDASEEEPKKEEFILVEVIDTLTPNSEIGYYVEYVSEWLLDSMKTEGFKCRWAYIEDLLPKGVKN